jgi:drug/metabolite transporter (DMT)-like permease
VVTELLLFGSTFTVVFALGFQQQNVTGGHYVAAFLTSFVIGGAYLSLYKLMPDASWSEVAAYLAGGPFGIVASMWLHKRTIGRRRRSAEVNPSRPSPR